MKKFSGSVLLMLVFVVVAIAAAAALAIGGINMVQRAVGAHTEEAKLAAQEQRAPTTASPGNRTAIVPGSQDAAPGPDWAEEKVRNWLASYGDDSIEDLLEPYRHVQAWYAGAGGELVLLTSGQKISDAAQLRQIAAETMKQLADDPQVRAVTVETSDGRLSATVHR